MSAYITTKDGATELRFTARRAEKLEELLGESLLRSLARVDRVSVIVRYIECGADISHEAALDLYDGYIANGGTLEGAAEAIAAALENSGFIARGAVDSAKKNEKSAPESAGELTRRLLAAAVKVGAYSAGLRDLTPAEIHDVITSAVNRQAEELRRAAVMAWNTAYLTGLAVNAPKRFPQTPQKHFAFLREGADDWRAHKAQMARIAAAHNRKFGGGASDR